MIRSDKAEPRSPLPYYYLFDALIADRRTEEAKAYLRDFVLLPAHKPFMARVYEAHIALAEFDEAKADAIMRELLESNPQDAGVLFEAAQYYAKKADYDKALDCYAQRPTTQHYHSENV